jgi:hypothetical protein
MYMGIILLALPISVVGSSFQREYARLYPEQTNEDEDSDEDETGTELDDVSGSERAEIKKSLAELNEKVTFLMEAMVQMQRQQGLSPPKIPRGANASPNETINVLHTEDTY